MFLEGRIYGSVASVARDPKESRSSMQILGDIDGAPKPLWYLAMGPVEMREARRRRALAVGIASNELRRFG